MLLLYAILLCISWDRLLNVVVVGRFHSVLNLVSIIIKQHCIRSFLNYSAHARAKALLAVAETFNINDITLCSMFYCDFGSRHSG